MALTAAVVGPSRPRSTRRSTARRADGATPVVVGWDGAARGVLAVPDAVKAEAAAAVRQLVGLGVTPILLAGAAMALSSVFVVSNSLWLRRFR